LEEEVEQLKHDFEDTASAIVGFYYYLIQIEYFQVQHRYDKASEYCLHLVDIVRNNPSVYRKRRLGIAYLNLSQNEIFNYYFDYSIGFAREAQKCFSHYTINHNLAIELEFYAHFYAGNMEEAERTANRLVYDEETEQSEFRFAWRNYLLACVHFVQGSYSKLHLALNETRKINKDKVGWNLGVRTLSILVAIEQEAFDSADSQILSMQQFMKQALKGQTLRERDHIILKLLLALRREGYQFSPVAAQCADLLTAISTEDSESDASWQVQSPELIVFHKWFESQLNSTSYTPNYSREYVHSLTLVEA